MFIQERLARLDFYDKPTLDKQIGEVVPEEDGRVTLGIGCGGGLAAAVFGEELDALLLCPEPWADPGVVVGEDAVGGKGRGSYCLTSFDLQVLAWTPESPTVGSSGMAHPSLPFRLTALGSYAGFQRLRAILAGTDTKVILKPIRERSDDELRVQTKND
jgi:hypothetical protein